MIGRCLAILIGALLLATSLEAEPVQVVIKQTSDGPVLYRESQPFFIRGVGGATELEDLAKIGGNSFRTWGAEQLTETRVGDDGVERSLLDHAHRLGLTVAAGYWLGHPRHGFDYNDPKAVQAQLDRVRSFVETYKDHPAILVWGIGNEVEIEGADYEQVFKAINDAARLVKSIDDAHPTMTVISEASPDKIHAFMRWCPDIDILGINSYGGLSTLGDRLREIGLDRPWIATEYGLLGHWEVSKSPWGAEYEMTSTQKAAFLEQSYAGSISSSSGCLGGYAFFWGAKQECTETWFGMLLADGTPLQSVEVLQEQWGGQPENRAPRVIGQMRSQVDPAAVPPGAPMRVSVEARDPDGDALHYEWVLRRESTDRRKGGDLEDAPPALNPAFRVTNPGTTQFAAPKEPGAYRLFVTIRDGDWAATANLPFYVKGTQQ
ncbi:MAG: glycoside hydrolase family 2 TIM barrel-domain containing protein [Planctomycetota bacterium]